MVMEALHPSDTKWLSGIEGNARSVTGREPHQRCVLESLELKGW